jgi:hypothetical protein
MRAVVYLSHFITPRLANDFVQAGYQVHPVFSAAEALDVCAQFGIDVVVIEAGLQDAGLSYLRRHAITAQLTDMTKAVDVVWELCDLLDWRSCTVH